MLGGLLALEPISRFTSSVRDGRYLDAIRQLAIEEDVWEAPNDGPPETPISIPDWESGRRFLYATHNLIDQCANFSPSPSA